MSFLLYCLHSRKENPLQVAVGNKDQDKGVKEDQESDGGGISPSVRKGKGAPGKVSLCYQ